MEEAEDTAGKTGPVRPGGRERHPGGTLLRRRWDVLLVIAAGGALGSLARWALAEAVPHSPGRVPWAIFLANVSGAFALGVLMVFVLDHWPPHRYVRPFLGVGVLGGYTTFSTYVLDTRTLLADGHPATALTYLFGTVVVGLLAVALGVVLARVLVRASQARHRRRRTTAEPATDHVQAPTERSTR